MKTSSYIMSAIGLFMAFFSLWWTITLGEQIGNPTKHYETLRAAVAAGEIDEPSDNGLIEITFNFFGDCTLASQWDKTDKDRFNSFVKTVDSAYFFDGVRDVLSMGDVNIANCEGTFTSPSTKRIGKNHSPAFWFRSDPSTAQIFSANNIHAVSLANNHANDYGECGYLETGETLNNLGILWGDGDEPVIIERQGIIFAVFFIKFWDDISQSTLDAVQNASLHSDIQIVYFHAGDEGIHAPDAYKIRSCHALVEAGADLVIGSHPHVLQPIENYGGVNIVYSIGNFIFGGNLNPENRTVVYQHTFVFENGGLIDNRERVYPCYIYSGPVNKYQPYIMENGELHDGVIDFMYGRRTALP